MELLLSPPPPLAALGSLGGLLGEGLGGLAGALPQGPLRDAVAPLAGALAGSARVPAPDAERESPAARLTLRHDYEVGGQRGLRSWGGYFLGRCRACTHVMHPGLHLRLPGLAEMLDSQPHLVLHIRSMSACQG